MKFDLLALIAFGCSVCGYGASDDEFHKAAMLGLKGVSAVEIFMDSEGIKQAGLSDTAIRTDTELKLRLAGMNINGDSPERLSIVVLSHKVSKDGKFYAVSLSVDLRQPASLAKSPNIVSVRGLSTWGMSTLLLVEGDQSGFTRIREKIKDIVDMLINEWLSVNPKTR